MVILETKELQSGYQGTPVLHDITFQVREGEIVAILGSNGAGKTTTLRTITGAVRATGGSVIYQGQPITKNPRMRWSGWAFPLCLKVAIYSDR